jgi:protein tyrosine phosphatase
MESLENDDYVSLSEITPEIWIGNFWAAYDGETIQRFGSILNLMSQKDERTVKPWLEDFHGKKLTLIEKRRQSLVIENVRLMDDHGNDIRHLRLAIDAVDELVRKSPPVLVHCRAGRGRSPAIVAGYFIVHRGMTAKDALGQVAQKRDIYLRTEGSKDWVVNFLGRLEDEARG